MRIAFGRSLPDDKEEAPIIMPPTLESQHTSFPVIHSVPVRVLCDHYTLGMIIGSFPDIDRVYLKTSFPEHIFPK